MTCPNCVMPKDNLSFLQITLGYVKAVSRNSAHAFLCVFLIGIFSLLPLHYAQALDTVSKQTDWPHDHSDLNPDPALQFGRLENGLRYVLMKNSEPKDRVSMYLNVLVGSIQEEDHEQGMAHFLEHMLFSGTTHFQPGELVKYFQSIGMQFGHDANARTGFYDTLYDVMLPTGDEKQLDKGLLVLSDYAQGALLLPDEIERERKVVLAEMNTRDSSSYRTFLSSIQFELPNTRFVQRMPIGKKEILQSMDRPAIKTFYDKWYAPDNIVVVLVGDFDLTTAARLITKHFGPMTRRNPKGKIPAFGSFTHKSLKAFYHYEKEEGNTTVTLEVAQKIDPIEDSFALQRQLMVQKIAERMVKYRIDDMLRNPNTPFSDAQIRSDYYYNQVFFAEITADCSPENWEQTLCSIEQILRQVLAFGFTNAELERAKKDILSDFDNNVKSMSSRDSKRLARQFIGALNDNRVFQSPLQTKDLFSPLVSQLTLKDAYESMKKTWATDHRLILVTGNKEFGPSDPSPEECILSVFKTCSAKEVFAPKEVEAQTFPYLPAADNSARIIAQTHRPESDTIHIDFQNNVRLNLKQTGFKPNEVLISAAFGMGSASEPEHLPGLSTIATDVIQQSGLGKMTIDELRNALAGKKTRLEFNIKQDHFSFEVSTTPDETDLAFELIKAQLLDPGFRQEAFELVQKRLRQHYEMLYHSVEGAEDLYGEKFLAGEDSRFGMPDLPQLDRVKLSNIEAWIKPALLSSPLEVSVVGNFDVDKVVTAASRCLGTLPERNAENKTPVRKGPQFPSGKSKTVQVETKIPKALIIVAYPTDDMWDIHQTRTLSLLSQIFSEKVRVRIREKLGAAYSPHVFNQPSRIYKNYGKMQAFIETTPESVPLVVGEVKRIAENIADNGITDEDVKYALDPILTSIKDMKRDNGYWLKNVLAGSKNHPEQLIWSQEILDDYAGITIKEVTQAAKKFLNNDNSAAFIAVPKAP